RPAGSGPVVDSIKPPRLPSEGLAVGYRHGMLLVSLNGTRIARLPGFRVFWQPADFAPLVLQGPTGRLYHLAGERLVSTARRAIPLVGGAWLVPDQARWRIVRAGRTLVSARYRPTMGDDGALGRGNPQLVYPLNGGPCSTGGGPTAGREGRRAPVGRRRRDR